MAGTLSTPLTQVEVVVVVVLPQRLLPVAAALHVHNLRPALLLLLLVRLC